MLKKIALYRKKMHLNGFFYYVCPMCCPKHYCNEKF